MAKRIVIGLDFGTTYSGIAYCDDTHAKEGTSGISLITSWPGLAGANANNEKVPSRIAYGPPPATEIIWGNQIRHNTKATVHACMKLKLDDKMKGSAQFRLLLAFLTQNFDGLDLDDVLDKPDGPPEYPGKDAVDMVADYLTKVREHAWTDISKSFGAALFESMRKELVVTVPAVWSERARDLTLKAVSRANFRADKICLVTEPEAAAIYTLKGMMEGANKSDIQVGDVFVLTDAGGGTVDLISYKITQIHPTFRIEEAAIGSGDKCGATYVDKEFLAWLEKWIGPQSFKKIPEHKKNHGSQLLTSFEANKFHFSGVEDGIDVTLPADCGIDEDEALNIDDRVLSITNAQMKQLFDPCVNRTLELIDGQVAAVMKAGLGKPKMVLVVGGFGRNAYLYMKIEEYCRERGIQTRQPRHPWSAVARGAVCRGLEGAHGGLVETRLARKYYGTPTSQLFNPRIHDEADSYTDEYTGMKYAKGQMNWLLDRGSRLPEDKPMTISISVCTHFTANEARERDAVLVGCIEDTAPRRFADDAAQIICRVRANFGDIPLSRLPCARKPNGDEYYEIAFKLEATFSAGEIAWRLIYEGREYGRTTVTYDD